MTCLEESGKLGIIIYGHVYKLTPCSVSVLRQALTSSTHHVQKGLYCKAKCLPGCTGMQMGRA